MPIISTPTLSRPILIEGPIAAALVLDDVTICRGLRAACTAPGDAYTVACGIDAFLSRLDDEGGDVAEALLPLTRKVLGYHGAADLLSEIAHDATQRSGDEPQLPAADHGWSSTQAHRYEQWSDAVDVAQAHGERAWRKTMVMLLASVERLLSGAGVGA